MTLTPQLAQQCLEALEYHVAQTRPIDRTSAAILALREAIASGEGDEARDGPLDAEDLKKIALVHEEFDDCGETSVDYEELMRFARMGLLECTHFMVTVKAREAIAKASPLGPLGDAAMKGNGK